VPTNLPPSKEGKEGKGTIAIDIVNVGEAPSGGPITVTDTLPEGVIATRAGELTHLFSEESEIGHELWNCSGNGNGGAVEGATTVTCTNEPSGFVFAGGGGFSLFTGPPEGEERGVGRPNLQPALGIAVRTESKETTGTNHVTIAGGGAPTPASTTDVVTVSSKPAQFGITGWDGWFSSADGTLDTQAGSHPYEATFSFDLASRREKNGALVEAGGELRNVIVELPPGFVGNPNAVPQCTRQQLTALVCPNASQVGRVLVLFDGGSSSLGSRVFNLVPPAGAPAELGFEPVEGYFSFTDASVRSGSDYGLTATTNNAPTGRQIVHVVVTLWGTPGDPSHLIWRANRAEGCRNVELKEPPYEMECRPVGETPKPFLTLPTACGASQAFTLRVDSWQHPEDWSTAEFHSHDSNGVDTGFTGCEDLQFGPFFSTSLDTAKADSPTGLTAEVQPPIGGLEDPELLGTADIKNTVVTLPPGLVINPGQAAGLQACGAAEAALTSNGPASCPNASKVGTVKAKTPLLEAAAERELEGNVYVLQSNPPDVKLLAAFSADGVSVKLVLNVELNEETGQITTRVVNIPEFPVSDFKLSFSGGPQAALDTPTQCGVYTGGADFTPWSSPFVADFLTSPTFALAEGPNGERCPSSPLPFGPTLVAGSTTDRAGGFTNFSLLLERGDGQQRIERLQFKAPPGLSGLISQVPLCPEPQATAGTCSEASKIGHATVVSGPGPYPLVIPQPGEPESPIFLTGPYQGAPFGLSIVTHVLAGPFNLGTIVTRARIEIDPHTAQIIVTTDPLPQVVAGVPTDLRLINSVIDRPGFMFNPTSCSSQEFSGTAYGTPPPSEGGPHAQAAISSHFGVGSCRELSFSPDFRASTSGKTSKAKGASLDVKVQYPNAPAGGGRVTSQANIASVKVELPKQLPSRLTTLQKACTAAQFASNPAGCPVASIVGHAVVHTPVLPVPLEGPAYFVSNGGEAFPNLIMVLQGYSVTVELVGDTFINKQGVTSSTFKSTPDVPFSSFELNLPEGPYSALAANASLCATLKTKTVKKRVAVRKRGRTVHLLRSVTELVPTLSMPTTIVGQNGAEIHQNTKIAVQGCGRQKAMRRKAKRHHGKGRRQKRTKK
jgi:hypothetical protein